MFNHQMSSLLFSAVILISTGAENLLAGVANTAQATRSQSLSEEPPAPNAQTTPKATAPATVSGTQPTTTVTATQPAIGRYFVHDVTRWFLTPPTDCFV
jgi:hypothetical protein